MDNQISDINELELTIEDMDQVNGGMQNRNTELYHAFIAGMVKGYLNGGGTVSITLS